MVCAWTDGVPFEASAKEQVLKATHLPIVEPHVAVMPDVHAGIGCTIGSVIPTFGAIVPAFVGVDIGCGVVATKLSLRAEDLPDNLSVVRSEIEQAIPHGRTNDGGVGDRGAWGEVPDSAATAWELLRADWQRVVDRHPKAAARNTVNHLGTLGGGNHFFEICLDERRNVWAMLHSGSRGLGNRFGQYFIELAKKDMAEAIGDLPDRDMAYFSEGTQHFNDYFDAVTLAQKFAFVNRTLMMNNALTAMRATNLFPKFDVVDRAINCHHNYVNKERHFGQDLYVTRKGAVRAGFGELGIIPGSMGAKSFIVKGKGNAESFCSCSHGAGRKMSRGEAKRTFSLAQHADAVKGVECRVDQDVIDETPGAYKDIYDVMEAQKDLVDVVATLKQVLCVKG